MGKGSGSENEKMNPLQARRFIRQQNTMHHLLVCLLFASLPVIVQAELSVGRPFADHMVLPMDRSVPIRGSAMPGADVKVSFGVHSTSGRADAKGQWRIVLPPQKSSSEARDLEIRSGSEQVILRDVLVGEVWLCSGQSNMDFPLAKAVGGKQEAAQAQSFSSIRLMNLTGTHTHPRRYHEAELQRLHPGTFFIGSWQTATEKSALEFSAVAWWAGKTIHQSKRVPIGLIDNSVGGSGAEAWLPREVLEAREEYASLLGETWIDSERIGNWARGRAKLNLGGKPGNHPFRSGFLFDSGVRWWLDFPLTGVMWYQGETNAEILDDAWNERLITDLVQGWRKVLAQPDLPFFMVQLPRIGGNDPLRRGWPQFRAVQASAAKKLKNVSLIETIDLGWDSPDVHPPDKRPVGQRLGKAVVE
jgi:sialate O-acetylesterase